MRVSVRHASMGCVLLCLASCAPGTEKLWDAAGGATGSILQQQGVLTGVEGAIAANAMGQSGTLISSLDISDEREHAVADYVSGRMLAEERRSRDGHMEEYLNRMVRWIASHGVTNFNEYKVVLIEDGTPNAGTPGGGWIFVSTGLIEVMENEAQLAMVLGHEIAHVIMKHPLRGARDDAVLKVAFESAMIAGGVGSGVDPLGDVLFSYTASATRSGHHQEFESEADAIGLELMVRARYDPREAPRMFHALRRATGENDVVANFLYGSHPLNRVRAQAVEELIRSRYAGVNLAKVVTNSPDYAELAQRYWH